ncbi:trypsin-like peptidase domain-containing protein [Streptosporangium sp. CA-115845]|uniref:nSTAND1 domain-containing NTPase n=1 Tax=Streptosporangium sp. CA-115845 TaxID=3240071 RepID=UPI003D8BFA29
MTGAEGDHIEVRDNTFIGSKMVGAEYQYHQHHHYPSKPQPAHPVWAAQSRLSVARVSGHAGLPERGVTAAMGGGCLVGPLDVVTCAHVVNDALGRDAESPPDEPVLVDFPLLGVEHAPIEAKVVSWSYEHDVAGLRLAEPPPAAAQPTLLLVAHDVWGHEFNVFGFPDDYDMGTWASGRILGVTGQGWLQVENTRSGGRVIAPGFGGAAVWDTQHGAMIGIVVAHDPRVEHRTAFVIPAELIIRVWPELVDRSLAASPYRGLDVFGESDAELFFGREEEAKALAAKTLRAGLTAVFGPSGCGKSSLLQAGVLPILRRDTGVLALPVRPTQGATPLTALAVALLTELEPELSESARLAEVAVLEPALRNGGLVETVGRVRARAGRERLVLLIDQFEEIYSDPAAAEEFVNALLPLLRTPGAATHVLLVLRADFMTYPLANSEFVELLHGALYPVGPLSEERLHHAIEGPLERTGVRFEPGLVRDILKDVGDQPGRMPLVQFALTMLWERRRGGLLTQATYDEIGGVHGALAGYAEKVWNERLAPDDHERARNLLLQLVRQAPGQPPTGALLRRSSTDEETWRLGRELADSRLLVIAEGPPGVQTLRLTHESLIENWERLRTWVYRDGEFRTWHHELRQAAERWHDRQDPAELLRGPRLAEALRWADHRGGDLSAADREFIAAGKEEEGSAERRRRRSVLRLRALLAAVLALLAVATYAYVLSRTQLRTLAAQTLATRAESAHTARDVAVLHALAAYRSDPEEPSVLRALFGKYADYADAELLLPGSGATSERVMASEDGSVVVQEESHGVRVWQPGRGDVTGRQLPFAAKVTGSVLNVQGDRLAIATSGGVIELWDPRAARLVDRAETPGIASEPRVLLGFDATGRRLLVHDRAGNAVVVWDGERHRAIRLPDLGGRELKTVEMSEDDVVSAYAGSLESGVDNWLLVSKGEDRFGRGYTLPAARKRGTALAHDGRTLVTCRDSADGIQVTTYGVRTGKVLARSRLPHVDCTDHPDPGRLSHGGRLLLLRHALVDLTAREIVGGPAGASVSPVATGADGRWSIWDTGRGGVFEVTAGHRLVTNPHRVLATAVVGDKYVVTVDDDDRLRVWNAESGLLRSERPARLREGAGERSPLDENAVRVVPLPGRQEVALARADTRELVLLSVPDLRPIGSATLPAPAAPHQGSTPFSLHATPGGRVVAFAGGLVSRWESVPLRLVGPPLDLSGQMAQLSADGDPDTMSLLPGYDGTAALLVTRAARRVQRYDLTLGRVTRDYLLPGRGPSTPVAVSGDLARLIVHNADDRNAFTLWNLPSGGDPAIGRLTGTYTQADAFDLFRLRQAHADLDYSSDFVTFRLNDALGHLTMFTGGRGLLYRTGTTRVLSTDPDEWARRLCAVSGGRRFAAEELSQLPDGTAADPCE